MFVDSEAEKEVIKGLADCRRRRGLRLRFSAFSFGPQGRFFLLHRAHFWPGHCLPTGSHSNVESQWTNWQGTIMNLSSFALVLPSVCRGGNSCT
jgi:hypothetical protein